MIRQTLSHYKVLEKLGSGGMGEVYVAEDTKLHRNVALKILPPELASEERRHRFEREAQAVAALNHPNIVTVFSVEEIPASDGLWGFPRLAAGQSPIVVHGQKRHSPGG